MAAWYDVQANPERITSVGNAALVAPGVAEVEAGAEVALGQTIAFLTPVRVKVGLYPDLQVHLLSEGFLVRPDGQRPAGLGAGLKVPLFADPESVLPSVAARIDAWSPVPAPADGLARLQAEVVASGVWSGLAYAAAAGGDFAANGASLPMGGLAIGWPDLGPFAVMAEGRFRAGLAYAGLSSALNINRESVIDLAAGYRFDGALLVRTGFTRSFALVP